jgi:hypothetical protein
MCIDGLLNHVRWNILDACEGLSILVQSQICHLGCLLMTLVASSLTLTVEFKLSSDAVLPLLVCVLVFGVLNFIYNATWYSLIIVWKKSCLQKWNLTLLILKFGKKNIVFAERLKYTSRKFYSQIVGMLQANNNNNCRLTLECKPWKIYITYANKTKSEWVCLWTDGCTHTLSMWHDYHHWTYRGTHVLYIVVANVRDK